MRRAMWVLAAVVALLGLAVLLLELQKGGEEAPKYADPTSPDPFPMVTDETAEPVVDEPRPAPAPTSAAAAPTLNVVTPAEYGRELGSGAGCDLLVEDQVVLVVLAPRGGQGGDALAKVDGRLTHPAAGAVGFPALLKGGRFAADDFYIRVDARPEVVARGDETVSRAARVEVARHGGERAELQGVWTCGA